MAPGDPGEQDEDDRVEADTVIHARRRGGKRAVSYLRVSSAAQAEKDYDSDGYSLPAQRAACARKAASLGADVVEVYVERR